jgi:hypothetical protein
MANEFVGLVDGAISKSNYIAASDWTTVSNELEMT